MERNLCTKPQADLSPVTRKCFSALQLFGLCVSGIRETRCQKPGKAVSAHAIIDGTVLLRPRNSAASPEGESEARNGAVVAKNITCRMGWEFSEPLHAHSATR